MKRLLTIIALLFVFFSVAHTTYAAQTYDLSDTNDYNIKIPGSTASDYLGWGNIHVANVIGDSSKDLIIGVQGDDNNSRSNSGSVYVIDNAIVTAITGKGQSIDLSNASNYSVRFDGATASDYLGISFTVSNIWGDSKNDLLIGASYTDYNSRSTSGSVYVISGELVSSYSGTGNNVDLATGSNWNIRYDGALASAQLGENLITTARLNNNTAADLVIGAPYETRNGRTSAGTMYIIYDSLIDDYSGTGNTVNLGTSTNWNVRYEGAAANQYLTLVSQNNTFGDLNNNSIDDLVITSYEGYFYVIYDTLFDDYTSTGNAVDLNTSSNYNIRYSVPSTYPTDFEIGDINANGIPDLMLSDAWNTPSYVYGIYDTLLSSSTGTGNQLALATSTNYSFRIQSAGSDDTLGRAGLKLGDYDNDSKLDLIVGAENADINGKSNSGALYFINNATISSLSGTGNAINLSDSTKYGLVYGGPGVDTYLGYAGGLFFEDIDGDGSKDFFLTHSTSGVGTDLGNLYLIYNFPHTLTNTQVTPTSNSIIYKGTINASNSVTTISGVQYQVDGNSPSSGWSSCTADDGAFDSTSEAYTCQSGTVSNGSHTIYVRSYDTNTSYTAQSSYGTRTVSIGDSNTTISGTNDAPQITQSSNGGNASGGAMSPVRDSSTNGQQIKIILEPNTFNFSAFVSAQSSTPITGYGALLVNPITGTTPKIGTKTNAVLAGTKLGVRTNGGVAWQVGNLQQIWYKAYAPAGSDKSPAKIIPELQKKQSIVALSYTDANLIPPGRPKSKFNNKTLKLAHSLDGITWKLLPTSVVDTKNKTVAALHKVGGYYMVVGR